MEQRAEYKAKKRAIHKEAWYIALAERLEGHKYNKSRARILRLQLMRDVMPDAKLISTYGESVGKGYEEISPKEKELVDLEREIQEVEAALDGLKETPRNIVILRFIEGVKDWHIYEIKIKMSKSEYYEDRNQAMEQIARCLGVYTENGQSADNERNTRAK